MPNFGDYEKPVVSHIFHENSRLFWDVKPLASGDMIRLSLLAESDVDVKEFLAEALSMTFVRTNIPYPNNNAKFVLPDDAPRDLVKMYVLHFMPYEMAVEVWETIEILNHGWNSAKYK